MNANEMDPHVSYLAFDGDTPMRILKDATGQIFTFEWVSLGYKVDGKTVSAMIPVPLSKDGELGDEYRIERKWRNKDTSSSTRWLRQAHYELEPARTT